MIGPDDFWRTLPLGRGVAPVCVDSNGLAAFSKPAGVLSHPNEDGDTSRSLLDAPYDRALEAYVWPGSEVRPAGRLWLLNRLDSATSGLLLAAGSEALARSIRELFQKRRVRKVYNALVFGSPRAEREVWRDRLAVEKHGGQIRTRADGNIPSEALVRVLRAGRGERPLAMIELEPKTGRSHQLRVQCAHRRLPIVGDATYGDFRANRAFSRSTGLKRLFLHSVHTEFDYPWEGRICKFAATAPLPEEFGRAFTARG